MSDLSDAIKKAADALAQLASQIEGGELSDAELGDVAGGIGGGGYADHGDHHDAHGDIG